MTSDAGTLRSRPSRPAMTTPRTRPSSSSSGPRTVTPSSKRVPAATASRASAASRSRRSKAAPRVRPPYVHWTRTPCSPVTIIPSMGSADDSNAPVSSRRRSMASVPGLIVSPHSLWRGNCVRSSISTRAPPRASTVAATDPAGPAPETITSNRDQLLNSATPNAQPTPKLQHPKLFPHWKSRLDLGLGSWELIGNWELCRCEVDTARSSDRAQNNGAVL